MSVIFFIKCSRSYLLQQEIERMELGQCRIECRIRSIDIMREVSSLGAFTSIHDGETFAIHCTVSAYNVQTEVAVVYVECERVEARVVEETLREMYVEEISIELLTETSRGEALWSVMECSKINGFTLLKNGGEPGLSERGNLSVVTVSALIERMCCSPQ